jgi:hypothetical protein
MFVTLQQMTESQAHGFTWETFIKKNVYKIQEDVAYTRKNDIDSHENTIDNCAISIKVSGGLSVDMGDARRVFDGTLEEPLHMVLIQYTQQEDQKVLQSVLEVDLTGARQELFGDLLRDDIARLHEQLQKIPHGPVTNKDYLHVAKELNAKSKHIFLRPKVDSKNQRRLQCSFTNINTFCEAYPERLLYKNTEGIFKGVQLVTSLLSGRRVRHPRMRV